MNLKSKELLIPDDDPFANCKLDRKQYADVLTGIVSTFDQGFVLAINNQWGTGKTTFIKMWQKTLHKEGYTTLYFNAWENDFEPDPLVAIIAELKNLTNQKSKEAFASLVKKGAVVVKKVLPDVIKMLAAKYIDVEAIQEILKNTTEAAADIFETEVEDYILKQKGLTEFREKLEAFIKKTEAKKPIVFLIDELDRCRPTYSVELLERVKHLFSVAGITFVLAIDKTQLGYAVKGAYGNDGIDTESYLKRFFDIEYSLPEPNTKAFCAHLLLEFDFDPFLHSPKRKQISEFHSDRENLLSISSLYFEKNHVPLRHMERIFAHMRLGLLSVVPEQYFFPNLYFTLLVFKNFLPDAYSKIRSKSMTGQDLLDAMRSIYSFQMDNYNRNAFIYLEAMLTVFYNNGLRESGITQLIISEAENKSKSVIHSNFDVTTDQHLFVRAINDIQTGYNISSTTLDYLLKKIDLFQKVII